MEGKESELVQVIMLTANVPWSKGSCFSKLVVSENT